MDALNPGSGRRVGRLVSEVDSGVVARGIEGLEGGGLCLCEGSLVLALPRRIFERRLRLGPRVPLGAGQALVVLAPEVRSAVVGDLSVVLRWQSLHAGPRPRLLVATLASATRSWYHWYCSISATVPEFFFPSRNRLAALRWPASSRAVNAVFFLESGQPSKWPWWYPLPTTQAMQNLDRPACFGRFGLFSSCNQAASAPRFDMAPTGRVRTRQERPHRPWSKGNRNRTRTADEPHNRGQYVEA